VPLLALTVFAASLAVAADSKNDGGAAQPNPIGSHPAATAAATGSDIAASVTAAIVEFVRAILQAIHVVTGSIWDVAMWIANRMIAFLANSIVNPVSGDRLLFGGAPGASRLAAPILALSLIAVVGISLAGPLYASWKLWRSSHNRRLRPH
jgi:phenylpyruvate tautomerase PptA (4-oxalocrotonate tautomerase family)